MELEQPACCGSGDVESALGVDGRGFSSDFVESIKVAESGLGVLESNEFSTETTQILS